MRRRISSNLRATKYIFIIIGSFFIIYFINKILAQEIHIKELSIISFFILINIILYYLFDKAKSVEYDNQFLYIKDKFKTEQIPLKDIFKITITTFEINKNNLWKISYYNIFGKIDSVRFLPLFYDKIFETFLNHIKSLNQKIEIKNYTHSFDFDQ